MLISLEDHCIHCAMRFEFKTSNNKAEYEALLEDYASPNRCE